MKILTWNVNRDNLFNEYACNFLLDECFDIIFLQEVNLCNLENIRSIFVNYDYFISKEKISSFSGEIEYYLVTLINKLLPCYYFSSDSLLLKTNRSLLYRLCNRSIYIEYTKVVVCIREKNITLVNCHLQYATSPSVRITQLSDIISNIDTDYFILSGDLNTFSKFPLSIFIGGIMSYSWYEYMINESKILLNSPRFLSGNDINTTIYYTGKLDWILLSKEFYFIEEFTLPRLGSDHYPLVVICEV
ncbi:MAG: endonuclease/exonuclease/phosphatase family protein [Pasteurellaceae bacterium]|nr:endonuclease/exonuclease/phosphatase family protein [Pasteurellaceae bacterium]